MDKTKTTIEEVLLMYKETVSPPKSTLLSILNQIPEKENLEWRKQAIRSPYRWLAIMQVAAFSFIIISVFPSFRDMYIHRNDPFYATDQQVERFEAGINDADYNDMLLNYNNLVSM
ncbi:MAG: hypothetical protein JWN37_185 [Candidatus Nomurabacteria bacterium]|nr:hypothetical protein [Candidatus Nomurabacteria bacterium]